MAEDEAVRKNRLVLLAELLREFATIAASRSWAGTRNRGGFIPPHGRYPRGSGVKPLLQGAGNVGAPTLSRMLVGAQHCCAPCPRSMDLGTVGVSEVASTVTCAKSGSQHCCDL